MNCAKCEKDLDTSVNPCDKCKMTLYCDRDCKKADWKEHKKICAKQANGHLISPPKGLSQPIAKPFTRLDEKIWLHGRPHKDVYRLLIDAHRLRAYDILTMEGKISANSVYDDPSMAIVGFRSFLEEIESKAGILPLWWSVDKKNECLALGMEEHQWYSLKVPVDKDGILNRYGSTAFMMELRVFVESVTGRGPGGISAVPFFKVLLEGEQALEAIARQL